jgi:predicted RNase H-like nuclease (RuvC/YqgF family)
MMPPERRTRVIDPERAITDLAREHEVLAGMTGADSRRIDHLVVDVGEIKGTVSAVKEQVSNVANGVNELRDALTVLVKHDLRLQHSDGQVTALREATAELDKRVHVLERQIGPVVEMRSWVIGGGLGILALIGLALAKLVMLP